MSFSSGGIGGAGSQQAIFASQALRSAQARQALQPRPQAPTLPQTEEAFNPALRQPVAAKPVAVARRIPLPYQEIQSIASQAGFVGLSDNDIERAYLLKQSLLVDTHA